MLDTSMAKATAATVALEAASLGMELLGEVGDAIATVTLNRPENRNSMARDVLEGLGSAVQKIHEGKSVRYVIITGRGKSFCAGADFNDRPARGDDAPAVQPHERTSIALAGNRRFP